VSEHSQSDLKIREVSVSDAPDIAGIYNWYIENTSVTFEMEPVTAAVMAERIEQAGPQDPWIVFEKANHVLGYAYAAPWKSRAAYAQAKETSVYVHHKFGGQGIGLALMKNLIDKIRSEPIHVLIAGITLPNSASVALHEKLGFTPVGQFVQVGYKFDQYIDVGYWQLLMERR
jgi:phosphinothricin acetyltransferase